MAKNKQFIVLGVVFVVAFLLLSFVVGNRAITPGAINIDAQSVHVCDTNGDAIDGCICEAKPATAGLKDETKGFPYIASRSGGSQEELCLVDDPYAKAKVLNTVAQVAVAALITGGYYFVTNKRVRHV